jgi:predicted metalloendopeptidase
MTLAALDQSGMNLPAREFYLKDDEKSKQIRDQYVKHVARMLELSGEPGAKAAADAQFVLTIETALANAAMDIVLRRDPKNQNNKMTLAQVQALTPSFNWKNYFVAMRAEFSQLSWSHPDFFWHGKAHCFGPLITGVPIFATRFAQMPPFLSRICRRELDFTDAL